MKCLWLLLAFAKISATKSSSLNPPINHNWTRVEKMDPNGILQMEWQLRDKEIVFNVTVNNRGFIAIGFLYQNPKIVGFDMALAWIDDRTKKANILVGFLFRSPGLYQIYTRSILQYRRSRRYV